MKDSLTQAVQDAEERAYVMGKVHSVVRDDILGCVVVPGNHMQAIYNTKKGWMN